MFEIANVWIFFQKYIVVNIVHNNTPNLIVLINIWEFLLVYALVETCLML